MAAVRCGRGHGYHASANDVRRCYNGDSVEIVPDPRAEQQNANGQQTKAPTDRQASYARGLLNSRKLYFAPGLESLDRKTISDVIAALRSGAAQKDKIRFQLVQQPVYCERAHCDRPPSMTVTISNRNNTYCGTHGSQVRSGDLNNRFTYGTIPLDDTNVPEPDEPEAIEVSGLSGVRVPKNDHGPDGLTSCGQGCCDPFPAGKRMDGSFFDPQQLEDGFYALPSDSADAFEASFEVYKVIIAVHGSGRRYAKRLDPKTGEWDMARGSIRKLRPGMRMTLKEALKVAKVVATNVEGRLYGRCFVCGRTLTREDSIDRMMGAVCAGKFM